MKISAGAVRQENLFNTIKATPWQEALLLLSLGIGAVILHASFRWSLDLPGHHGLEWIALLIVGRRLSSYRWAGTLASVGAMGATFVPLWGFSDPFIALIYLLPGLVIDLGYSWGRPWQDRLWFLGLVGAVAHATKPLTRLTISLLSGWPYGSLLYGLAYPLATHILFGFLGGLAGFGLVWGLYRGNLPKGDKPS